MDYRIKKRLDLRHIKLMDIYKIFVFAILLLPDEAFSILSIYSNKTPDYIAYEWLNFSYNILLLFVLVIGLLITLKRKDKTFWIVVVLILLREFAFLFLGMSSCFTSQSYEIYLALLTGIALAKTSQYITNDLEELINLFWGIIFANVLTVYLATALNRGFSNRHNAINMDVGSTGTICALLFVYCVFSTRIKHRVVIALLALVALFLSGSRVNLLLTVILLVVGFIIMLFQKKQIDKRTMMGFIGLAVIGLIVLVYLDAKSQGIDITSSGGFSRMMASFQLNEMGNDSSVLGRTHSIAVGFEIMKTYPFGISGFFTNIQLETIERGFPTFPHSALLDLYLFLGPIVICLVVRIVKTLGRLIRKDYAQFMILLYTLAFLTLSGGPIVNFKLIFFYYMIIHISYCQSKSSNNELTMKEKWT